MKLTEKQREELDAIRLANDACGRTFIMRHHWHASGYAALARRGLITWSDPPAGFRKSRFAGVEITEAGRRALEDKEQ